MLGGGTGPGGAARGGDSPDHEGVGHAQGRLGRVGDLPGGARPGNRRGRTLCPRERLLPPALVHPRQVRPESLVAISSVGGESLSRLLLRVASLKDVPQRSIIL